MATPSKFLSTLANTDPTGFGIAAKQTSGPAGQRILRCAFQPGSATSDQLPLVSTCRRDKADSREVGECKAAVAGKFCQGAIGEVSLDEAWKVWEQFA